MKTIQSLSLLSTLTLLPLSLLAQGTPSAQQMIEQLQKPVAPIVAPAPGLTPGGAPGAAPRTRSLRNLTIESTSNAPAAAADAAMPAGTPAAVAAAPAPRPSLSLQIQFDFNSAKVRPESQQALANLAQALKSKELEASRFAIEGHTDAKGALDYNQRLSQQRADAVRDYLATQGVAMLRLSSVGKGSSELALPDAPLAPENRRVRIVNLD